VIGKCGVQVPDVPDPSYACPTNKDRNGISAGVFKNHIIATHPLITSNELPPDHTLMIEASIRTKSKKVSQAVHDVITTMLGDNDIKVSEYNRSSAKINPLLQASPGSQEMCISNDDLKQGRGNGTLCRVLGVKLKRGARRQWKNWEGRKVYTVSVDEVDWVEFEH
jgi:hypothetical protein